MHRIMLVDDETNILNALRRLFALPLCEGSAAPTVETFTSPRQALERAREAVFFDAVISDYRMPEMDGVAFLKAFREIQPNAVRLVLSGYADLDVLVGAINEAQIFRFIAKPWSDFELRAVVSLALAYHDLQMENQRLADIVRAQIDVITRQERELRHRESEMPAISKAKWDSAGAVSVNGED